MSEIEIIIKGFYEAGASKEQVMKIWEAIFTNKVDANDKDAMDKLLLENLSMDTYIAFNNMKLINGDII